ncbi:MAG TPA: hypothetical protein VFA52_03485 [Candidatus Paceibacterota bacterium]|nr:hypothetical protein [Candidatus Paceibacterota bacterium]
MPENKPEPEGLADLQNAFIKNAEKNQLRQAENVEKYLKNDGPKSTESPGAASRESHRQKERPHGKKVEKFKENEERRDIYQSDNLQSRVDKLIDYLDKNFPNAFKPEFFEPNESKKIVKFSKAPSFRNDLDWFLKEAPVVIEKLKAENTNLQELGNQKQIEKNLDRIAKLSLAVLERKAEEESFKKKAA